jgi:hypothetical protein
VPEDAREPERPQPAQRRQREELAERDGQIRLRRVRLARAALRDLRREEELQHRLARERTLDEAGPLRQPVPGLGERDRLHHPAPERRLLGLQPERPQPGGGVRRQELVATPEERRHPLARRVHDLALHRDQLLARVALESQPLGVRQPRRVVVGRAPDRVQVSLLLGAAVQFLRPGHAPRPDRRPTAGPLSP